MSSVSNHQNWYNVGDLWVVGQKPKASTSCPFNRRVEVIQQSLEDVILYLVTHDGTPVVYLYWRRR
jgi:hypothetical protein